MVSYWLLVERLENWQVDEQEGFRRFGLPAYKTNLANQIKKGDILIFYVSSGISMLSDIREATADGSAKLGRLGDYDTAFPLAISTRPYLTLPRDKWVPFRELIQKLSITTGKTDWRQIMRQSLRRISEKDAEIIVNAMKQAQKTAKAKRRD